MADQGWIRTSRLVHITDVSGPIRYAVEELCAGQLMGELAGASACCLTRSAMPGRWQYPTPTRVRHRIDILLGRHLITGSDEPPLGYARSARLDTLALAPQTAGGVLVTARWRTHGRTESCWLGFGDGPDARTFLLLLRSAVDRAGTGQVRATGGRLRSGVGIGVSPAR